MSFSSKCTYYVRALSTSVLCNILHTGSIQSNSKQLEINGIHGPYYQHFSIGVIDWQGDIEKCSTWEAHSQLARGMPIQFLDTAAKELGCNYFHIAWINIGIIRINIIFQVKPDYKKEEWRCRIWFGQKCNSSNSPRDEMEPLKVIRVLKQVKAEVSCMRLILLTTTLLISSPEPDPVAAEQSSSFFITQNKKYKEMSLVANEEFQHILRVLNTNVDGKQKIMFALTSIKGIGRRFANIVCKKADVDMNKRAGELTAQELDNLMTIVANPRQFKIPDWFLNRQKDYKDGKYSQVVSNALDMKLRDDLERLKKIRNHRGLRHYWGLRVRGQHTKTTGRRGKTVGVSKKR
ncbi:hypothetical protein PTKIN_Ptkin01aG0003200 [Pterospermum kingtungense]